MKRFMLAATLLLPAVLVSAADDSKVTFVGHQQAAQGGSLATAPGYSVMVLHRDKAGMAEVHEKETDTFYVLDGAATIVTGGTVVGGSITAPGQQRGSSIEGGTSHRLSKGDVIVIPAGVPHWFEEVPKSIDYYVVKIIAP
jgi:quercetin dioxygenase-like cupin family protein